MKLISVLFAWTCLVLAGAPAAAYWFWPAGEASPKEAIALAALFGAMGAAVHSINSLSVRLGRGDFNAAWALWYASRPFVGACYAILAGIAASLGLFALAGGAPSVSTMAFMGGAAGLSTHDAGELIKRISAKMFGNGGPAPAQEQTK